MRRKEHRPRGFITRDQAVKYINSFEGFKAQKRDWALGETIMVCYGEKFRHYFRTKVAVFKNTLYLVPYEGEWAIDMCYVPGPPIEEWERYSLKKACKRVIEILINEEQK